MTYRKNDRVTVEIEDIGSDGEGIGKADGFTLFVKDAVIGDRVEARIVKSKKAYAYARLEKVIEPSPFRVEPKCAFHRACGGCQLQPLAYEKQLEFKEKKIRGNLVRIGGFDAEYVDRCMEPILRMEEPFHYRNKAQYPVGYDREGNLITGFYAGRTHSIIANTSCCLGDPRNETILKRILDYMRANGVRAYEEETGRGLVRHILIRTSFSGGEIMVCLVLNKKMTYSSHGSSGRIKAGEGTSGEAYAFLPKQEELLAKLSAVEGVTSVSVNINTENTNVILGKETYTIWGKPSISDTIRARDMQKEGYPFTGQELTFQISPQSFYQVNSQQTEKLYSTALEYAGLTGQETVWDLYCGIGTISLFLAASAKKVYGVEIVPQAIEDARENARRNGIHNVEFFVGRAEEVLPEFYADCEKADQKEGPGAVSGRPSPDPGMLHPDVIVVDPPRKGCDEACLATMLKMQPQRIVYVSCDSATLSRDLRVLCDGGYELKRVRGCDMFPQTGHVETVCLLSKRNVKQHIEVELTMDEIDLTAAEKK